MLGPGLCSLPQWRHAPSPQKGPGGDLVSEMSLVQGKPERSWAGEKRKLRVIKVYKYCWEGVKKTEPDF